MPGLLTRFVSQISAVMTFGVVGFGEACESHHVYNQNVSDYGHHGCGCGGCEAERAYFGCASGEKCGVGLVCELAIGFACDYYCGQ